MGLVSHATGRGLGPIGKWAWRFGGLGLWPGEKGELGLSWRVGRPRLCQSSESDNGLRLGPKQKMKINKDKNNKTNNNINN